MGRSADLGCYRGHDRQSRPPTGADVLILPDAPWRTLNGLPALLEALDVDEGATRFVGGCVRDTLLGLTVNDVDLATRLRPEEVVRRLQIARIKAVPTGLAHGTITAVLAG